MSCGECASIDSSLLEFGLLELNCLCDIAGVSVKVIMPSADVVVPMLQSCSAWLGSREQSRDANGSLYRELHDDRWDRMNRMIISGAVSGPAIRFQVLL